METVVRKFLLAQGDPDEKATRFFPMAESREKFI
jgi:hypothetical protein